MVKRDSKCGKNLVADKCLIKFYLALCACTVSLPAIACCNVVSPRLERLFPNLLA